MAYAKATLVGLYSFKPCFFFSSVAKALGNMNKNMLDAAMLQLLATQMMTQQATVAKMNG